MANSVANAIPVLRELPRPPIKALEATTRVPDLVTKVTKFQIPPAVGIDDLSLRPLAEPACRHVKLS